MGGKKVTKKELNQWSIAFSTQDDDIRIWVERFLVDRKVEGFSPGTIHFYRSKLALFIRFCEGSAITSFYQVEPNELRGLLQWLEITGHNPGGRNAVYRAVKTFVRWWSKEIEPENWKDPFKKVKPPKVSKDPLEPVSMETVRQLLKTCNIADLTGARDYAIFYTLIDTGIRASELLSIERGDLDLILGSVLIRRGKGGKPRTVFIGKATKRAIKKYLSFRKDISPALWITAEIEPLTYWGLVSMLKRRSRTVGIKSPGLHDFRRAFALGMLRNGVDLITLQKLMGHADLQVLDRYLAQTTDDLAAAHRKYGPGDKLK